ncbi:MAG: hypothetical protein KDD41_08535 [Flavobacteriales bacterium]|nr:hypothetical protein [Flavobacteriales bacterium]
MTDKKSNRLNNIIKDLGSDDKSKVLTAIKQLRKHGNRMAILPLIELLNTSKDDEITADLIQLLYDLKDQAVVDDLITAIEDETYAPVKAVLISIFWQSKLDGSDYLNTFIQQAIHGDYATAIEVMTVIDNLDASFDEEEISNLRFDLDDALQYEEDEEKAKLLATIQRSLNELNIEYD